MCKVYSKHCICVYKRSSLLDVYLLSYLSHSSSRPPPPASQPAEAEGADYINPQRADRIDTESPFNPIQSQALANERGKKQTEKRETRILVKICSVFFSVKVELYHRFVLGDTESSIFPSISINTAS